MDDHLRQQECAIGNIPMTSRLVNSKKGYFCQYKDSCGDVPTSTGLVKTIGCHFLRHQNQFQFSKYQSSARTVSTGKGLVMLGFCVPCPGYGM